MSSIVARFNSLDTFTKAVIGSYVALSGIYSVVNTEGKAKPAHEDAHHAPAASSPAPHGDAHAAHAAQVRAHANEGHALIVVPSEAHEQGGVPRCCVYAHGLTRTRACARCRLCAAAAAADKRKAGEDREGDWRLKSAPAMARRARCMPNSPSCVIAPPPFLSLSPWVDAYFPYITRRFQKAQSRSASNASRHAGSNTTAYTPHAGENKREPRTQPRSHTTYTSCVFKRNMQQDIKQPVNYKACSGLAKPPGACQHRAWAVHTPRHSFPRSPTAG